MPIDRSTLYRGPAVVTRGGVTMYSHTDVQIDQVLSLFAIETSQDGHIDDRDENFEYEVSLVPAGVKAYSPQLVPFGSYAVGDSMLGAIDTPLTVQTKAGQLYTFGASCLFTPPDIILSAKKTLWGNCMFKCVRKNNTAWATANSILALTSNAFSGSFDPATVITERYSAAWGGASPWSAFGTQDGWVIKQALSLDPVPTDGDGYADYTFDRLIVTAKAIPLGAAESDMVALLGIQGTGAGVGRSRQSVANDLVISSASVTVTLNKAAPVKNGFMFGAKVLRQAPVQWMATRTSGTPLITFA